MDSRLTCFSDSPWSQSSTDSLWEVWEEGKDPEKSQVAHHHASQREPRSVWGVFTPSSPLAEGDAPTTSTSAFLPLHFILSVLSCHYEFIRENQ